MFVMISHKAKVGDHRPKALPSRERTGFDDEAGKAAGKLDVPVELTYALWSIIAIVIVQPRPLV
ncbi:hypothetical protein, partial [Streptomyces doebereineriae]